LEETRKEIETLQNQLLAMYSMLDEKYCQTFEIEEAEAAKTENLDSFSSRLSDLIVKLDSRAKDAGLLVEEAQAQLVTATAELETTKNELEVFRAEKAQAEKAQLVADRKEKLASAGITITEENADRLDFYLSLSEETFTAIVNDLTAVKGTNKEVAENKRASKIPEPYGTQDIDLVSAHKELVEKEKRG
jgi:hypothetical protein